MHSSQNQYRERDVFARGSEQRMGELEYYDESPPTEPMMTSDVPSLGKRMFRTSARFLIAVLIGVGATLAWQSYRGEAREMVGPGPVAGLVVTRLNNGDRRGDRNSSARTQTHFA